ncbi:hypothetical protein HYZ78_01115 [Candidatus Microgenomates bacterium]|nr:hypothetical protein [Candidatus Microgenomates bacterium]
MKKANWAILLFVLIAVLAFFLIAGRFGGGEKGVESEKPITTCQADKCFYTAHLHFNLEVFTSGQKQKLPFEKGDLEVSHTHAEEDLIHWHATLPVDPQTQQVTDWSALKLKVILDEFGINYQDKKVTVLVNGQERTEGLEYIWQDGNKMEVRIE